MLAASQQGSHGLLSTLAPCNVYTWCELATRILVMLGETSFRNSLRVPARLCTLPLRNQGNAAVHSMSL